MEGDSLLPVDFDELPREEKISRLEDILERLDDDTDAGAIQKRMVEELLDSYRE